MTTQEQTTGAGFSAGQNQGQGNQTSSIQVGSTINGVTVDRIVNDASGNPRPFVSQAYLDQFPKNRQGQPILPSQTRLPNYQQIGVIDVRMYRDIRNNSRVALNNGAIHLSANQLKSANVFNPVTLKGKKILVDFFQRGDVLINGSIVTDPGRIVNRFSTEPDEILERELEKDLRKEQLTGWLGLASISYGANNRGTGEGTQMNTANGVTPTSQVPQMQSPADARLGQGASQDQTGGTQGGDAQGAGAQP